MTFLEMVFMEEYFIALKINELDMCISKPISQPILGGKASWRINILYSFV